jgi:tetratricopeptide (TPR) repeat protein
MKRFLLLPVLAVPLLTGALCGNVRQKTAEELRLEAACVRYQEEGDLNRAETACDLCLEYAKGRNSECLNALGLVFLFRENVQEARTKFKTAIRENPDFAEARNNMGVLEFREGNFQAAAPFFESAIEINPRYQDGRYNLALTYLRLGQRDVIDKRDPKRWFAKAETQYRRLFELFPGFVKAYHDMGVIMSFRADNAKTEEERRAFTGDAETYYVRCLDLEPAHETCHGNLARLYLSTGRFDESLFHYVQCLAANKTNPICSAEMQEAYKKSQLASESLQKYMTQLAKNPGYAPGHYGFCIALFDKGLVDMAVTECENTLKLDDQQCLAYYQLALHYKQVLDKDNALENCRGLITCAGETRYEAEVGECKEIVAQLEVQ